MSVKLLFVDDEAAVLAAIKRCVRKHFPSASWELKIDCCTNPLDAVKQLSVERYDVVIADYRMPEMNGVRFLEVAVQWQPDTARVILSATEDFKVLMQAVNEANISRFIPKPWDELQLIEVLKQGIAETRERVSQRHLANERQLDLNKITPQEFEMRILEQEQPGLTYVKWGPDGEVLLNGEDS